MGLATVVTYVQSLLDEMPWPPAMQALTCPPPPLRCYIQPPDPNVLAAGPSAYTWYSRGDVSRNPAKYGAGTIPRAQYQGGPSGTKAFSHMVPLYIVWTGRSPTDPYADTLFPGMIDAVINTLQTSQDPVTVVDPWTSAESELVDVGETITYLTALRALEPMQSQRLDALLECSVVEVISG